MEKVIEFHKEGYNCAESVLKAFNEDTGLVFQYQLLVLLGLV